MDKELEQFQADLMRDFYENCPHEQKMTASGGNYLGRKPNIY
jgi:hypothetical protein